MIRIPFTNELGQPRLMVGSAMGRFCCSHLSLLPNRWLVRLWLEMNHRLKPSILKALSIRSVEVQRPKRQANVLVVLAMLSL